jgi:hypothetical protein
MSKTTANLGQNKDVLVHEDLLGVSLARSAPLVAIFFNLKKYPNIFNVFFNLKKNLTMNIKYYVY